MFKILTILLLAITPFQGVDNQSQKSYPVKSGMIKYKLEGRTNGSRLIYFDNYGALIYLEDIFTKPNVSANSEVKILCCDTLITINDQTHTAQVQIINQADMQFKDNIISPEILHSLGYCKTGSEEVSGMNCDKYEGDNGKIWIWKNLIFKTEMHILNSLVKKEVVEFNPKQIISASRFKIPKNYKIVNTRN